jgi:hypothetical protein
MVSAGSSTWISPSRRREPQLKGTRTILTDIAALERWVYARSDELESRLGKESALAVLAADYRSSEDVGRVKELLREYAERVSNLECRCVMYFIAPDAKLMTVPIRATPTRRCASGVAEMVAGLTDTPPASGTQARRGRGSPRRSRPESGGSRRARPASPAILRGVECG